MIDTSVSLLDRLRTGSDEAAWRRLDDLYRPLLLCWLRRLDPDLREEAEDVLQEVMSVLVRELPGFSRQRPGSFRCWLRAITVHRVQAFWRSPRQRPRPLGTIDVEAFLADLADPSSELSRRWDQEHDQHVVHRLLEMLEGDFAPSTFQAFRRVVFEDARPAEVAAELGLTVNAVLLAKSRVLSRLRLEGRDLLD